MAGPAVLSVGAGILLSMSDVEPSALAAVLAGEDSSVRRAVQLVGQILTGSVTTQVTLAGFLHAMLGRSGSDLVCESRRLSSIGHVAAGLALAALIDRFDPRSGPATTMSHRPGRTSRLATNTLRRLRGCRRSSPPASSPPRPSWSG